MNSRRAGVAFIACLALLVLVGACAKKSSTVSSPSVGAPSATPQSTDPEAIHQAEIDAINRGDVAGAIALYTDHSTLTDVQCHPCRGIVAIRRRLQVIVAAHTHVTVVSSTVAGNSVTSHQQVTSVIIRAAGVARILNTSVTTVSGGRIVSRVTTPDPSDHQTATYLAYVRAHPQPSARP